jgi:glycerol-3-phosphate acyltransferase PlsY
MILVLIFCFSFFLGSIPFGYYIAKLFAGIDPRTQGSGNIGATNIARVVGKPWGLLVLILDALKGALPLIILSDHESIPQEYKIGIRLGLGLTSILGHIFTPFLGFKGGKGVSTALGVFLVLLPIPMLSTIPIFLLTYFISKKVSLCSMVSAGFLPINYWIWSKMDVIPFHREEILLLFFIFILILFSHRANIRRLLQGDENSIEGSHHD